jgi:mannonate dehydratase
MGIPGEDSTTLESLTKSIEIYQKIGAEGLRANLNISWKALPMFAKKSKSK